MSEWTLITNEEFEQYNKELVNNHKEYTPTEEEKIFTEIICEVMRIKLGVCHFGKFE